MEEDFEYVEPKRKRKPRRTKQQQTENNREFQRTLNEYRHLFDMNCDYCSKPFETLKEARKHYLAEHNNRRGYIKAKSNNKRMFFRHNVLEHIELQFNPDKYKYTFVCPNI